MMLDSSKKRYGHFYLCISKNLDKYNGPSQNKGIAFDPRMRTFCTGYDPDGIIVEVRKIRYLENW
jgi:hypothetical protein